MPERLDGRVEATIELYESLVRSLKSESMNHWVALNLTTAQLKVLFSLTYRGPATIGQVAEMLGVSLPTASHLVDKLVQSGFVDRAEDPADRRRMVARTSPKGEELVTRLREGGRQRLASWLGRLDDQDLAAVHHGLSILAQAAHADLIRDCPFDHARQDERRDDVITPRTNRIEGD